MASGLVTRIRDLCAFTAEQGTALGLLIGNVLSDGYIEKRGKNYRYGLVVNKKEHLAAMDEAVESLIGDHLIVADREEHALINKPRVESAAETSKTDKCMRCWRSAPDSPLLRLLQEACYRQSTAAGRKWKKILPEDLEITVPILASFFLGDGTTRKGSGGTACFLVYDFSDEEVNRFCDGVASALGERAVVRKCSEGSFVEVDGREEVYLTGSKAEQKSLAATRAITLMEKYVNFSRVYEDKSSAYNQKFHPELDTAARSGNRKKAIRKDQYLPALQNGWDQDKFMTAFGYTQNQISVLAIKWKLPMLKPRVCNNRAQNRKQCENLQGYLNDGDFNGKEHPQKLTDKFPDGTTLQTVFELAGFQVTEKNGNYEVLAKGTIPDSQTQMQQRAARNIKRKRVPGL